MFLIPSLAREESLNPRALPQASASRLRDPLGCLEQLCPGDELHTGATELLAGCALELVDRRPAAVDDRAHAALDEQPIEVLGGSIVPRRVAEVFEQQLDCLRGVLLIGADHAARAALDPPGDVDARGDAAVLVRDRSAALVERDARKRDAAVADAAEDDAALEGLRLARRHGAQRAARVRLEAVVYELDPLDPVVAENRDRREQEPQ